MKYLWFNDAFWEIEGNMITNKMGGHTSYEPSYDDEIFEAKNENELCMKYGYKFRNDDEPTGWLSPTGEFYGCKKMNHDYLAIYLTHGKGEQLLENSGWIKLYSSFGAIHYIFARHMTQAQSDYLESRGLL